MLEQIKKELGSGDTILLKALLKGQPDEIEKIQSDTELKSLVRRKLNKICSGGSIMEERKLLEIDLKEFKSLRFISARDTISMDNIGAVSGRIFETAFKKGITRGICNISIFPGKKADLIYLYTRRVEAA